MPSDVLSLPEKWAAGWSSPDPQVWLDLYTPDANYKDHAFRISRTGHELLGAHFQIWRHANPDFKMVVDPATPVWWREVDQEKGNAQCSFRTINTGTFKNDLPFKKASGRTFEFSGVIDFVIEHGRIAKVNEWYTIEYDLSVPVAQYRS